MEKVYIGKLNKAGQDFKWDGGNWNGNIPDILSPYFPNGRDISNKIYIMIRDEKCEGKQLDWGSFGIKMRKEELSSFVNDCEKEFGGDYSKIQKYVKRLPNDNEPYVLVSMELD